ncbi:type VII secretion protein EccB, partial [Streptomyces sp. NPDC002690]
TETHTSTAGTSRKVTPAALRRTVCAFISRPPSEYLVTDAGVAYPLAPKAAQQLGYEASSAVRLPYRLLRLFPQGPLLDPAAANRAGPLSAAGPNDGGDEPVRTARSYTSAQCGPAD